MAKYIFMYYGGKRPQSPQEFAGIMEAWRTWTAETGKAVLDSGNPLSQTALVTPKEVQTTPEGEVPTGYSIIEAENMEQAIQIAQTTPVVQSGGNAMVYETFKVI
jgi:hypothetical protein